MDATTERALRHASQFAIAPAPFSANLPPDRPLGVPTSQPLSTDGLEILSAPPKYALLIHSELEGAPLNPKTPGALHGLELLQVVV